MINYKAAHPRPQLRGSRGRSAAGGVMRTARLAKLTLGIALVSVLVGCTSLWNPRNVTPPPLKPDSEANFQALSTQLGDNCSAPILEPERSALLQEALADSQLQAVKAQLERRGLSMNAD